MGAGASVEQDVTEVEEDGVDDTLFPFIQYEIWTKKLTAIEAAYVLRAYKDAVEGKYDKTRVVYRHLEQRFGCRIRRDPPLAWKIEVVDGLYWALSSQRGVS